MAHRELGTEHRWLAFYNAYTRSYDNAGTDTVLR